MLFSEILTKYQLMGEFVFSSVLKRCRLLTSSLIGAVLFYTVIPIPSQWTGEFLRISRWIPLIGLLIGGLLGLADWTLQSLQIPIVTRSVLVIVIEVAITGGLHLDGAIDTADGLAVTDPDRRLEVMKDSVTGAFGAIAVAIILLLKTAALSDITHYRWVALMLAAGWARWGQVMAIAFYPYLRKEGKGAFHKENFSFVADISLGLACLGGYSGLLIWLEPQQYLHIIVVTILSSAIALLVGYWLYRQFQGHTGDTYGAVVEWSEALILCALTGFNCI